MSPMQSGSKFTDRITKYLTKSAERKTRRASKSKGHVISLRSSALLGLVSLIFLLTIPHRFSMGFRSGEFAGQSSTVTPWSL